MHREQCNSLNKQSRNFRFINMNFRLCVFMLSSICEGNKTNFQEKKQKKDENDL